MKLTDLIPANIQAVINKVLDLVSSLMQGETVLLIGNSAGVVLYLVAKAFGSIPDLTFEDSLKQGAAAVVTLNVILLYIRSKVYSAATVAKIVTTPPTAAGPVNAAIDAGAGNAINTELDKQEPSA